MPGLVPGIHVLSACENKDVDGRAFAAPKGLRSSRRDKPGQHELDVTVYIVATVGYFVLHRFDFSIAFRLHHFQPLGLAIRRHAEFRA
jgi:hypothetical protein